MGNKGPLANTSEISRFKEVAPSLFTYNLRINGPGALIYAHGLGACRYVEYASVLLGLLPGLILDVGCGRSILPSYLLTMGFFVVGLDVDEEALRWQKKWGVEVVLASGTNLPFRDSAFNMVCAISSIEHIPGDGDTMAVKEMERVLATGGRGVITVPFSHGTASVTSDQFYGIPGYLKAFRPLIKALFDRLGLRRGGYFMRTYDRASLRRRIIDPLGDCAYSLSFFGNKLAKYVYKALPMSVVSVLEFLLALLSTAFSEEEGDGVIVSFSKGGLGNKKR